MVYIYVLRSLKSKIYYVGMTKDVKTRIKEHNTGKTKFTKGHRPWELIYSEKANDFEEGWVREKYLKSTTGKNGFANKVLLIRKPVF